MTIIGTRVQEIAPDHSCDRCGHGAKFHPNPIAEKLKSRGKRWNDRCRVASGRIWEGKAQQCWCDGYVPRP